MESASFIPRLVIPVGDPAGIGPEVVLKAIADSPISSICQITLIGTRTLLEKAYHDPHLLDRFSLIDLPYNQEKIVCGRGDAHSGEISFLYLQEAIKRTLKGEFDGIVTGPIAKSCWQLAGYDFPGQTEVLATMAGINRYGMLFVAKSPHTGYNLRTLLATTHIPLREVPDALNPDLMTRKLDLLIESLKLDFGIDRPKIAISGLNPHSGEAGKLGREEKDWLQPWLESMAQQYPQTQLIGLVPPDTLWVEPGRAWFSGAGQPADAYLALYHDQGLIPVKLMAFDSAVNTTIGLPFVRTSPDHGTAFDIAGLGIARSQSMQAAIQLAIELCQQRDNRRTKLEDIALDRRQLDMGIASVNPATGEILKTFTPLTSEELAAKLALAEATFQQYRRTAISERGQWLRQAADILERDQVALAKTMTLEMGKPIKSAIAEVLKCALVCRFYADNAAGYLEDVLITTDASRSFVRYQPLGVILAVMPWNFPLWQVFRFAAPALMAGNVGLLKHASNVPQSALAVARILLEAGFPEGAFQTLLIGADRVSDLINDERVKAATLTGSEPAGISLAAAAGKQIKKVVLELGGSDPFIVLDSADIEAAAATAVTARLLNNGQTCIAAKRFIVMETVADQFEQLLVAKFQALKVGDPLDETVDIGPLATVSIVSEIAAQVEKTVAMGGKVLVGGQRLEGKGNFYLPTILTDIPAGSPGEKEEFFGPVALLFRVKNTEEAIALANDSPFGLGSSAWTNNPAEIERLITEIEAGCVFINGMVKSDPRLPFGGIKRSGFGRELSVEGIREFVNVKTVWIK